jgi:MFS family permease
MRPEGRLGHFMYAVSAYQRLLDLLRSGVLNISAIRPRAYSLSAITTATGPILGGWLIEYASWRWTLFINVPLAAVVIALASRARRRGCTANPQSRPGHAWNPRPSAGLAPV